MTKNQKRCEEKIAQLEKKLAEAKDEAKRCAEEEKAEVTRYTLSHTLLLTAPELEIVEKIKKLQIYLSTTQDSGIYRIDASERLKNEFSCLGKMLYERYRQKVSDE